jgi:nucleoid DNA-binding protein
MMKQKVKRPFGGHLLAPRNTLTKKELIQLVSAESKYFFYEVEDILSSYYKVIYDQLILGKDIHIEGVVRFRHRLNPARYLKNKQGEVYKCKPSRTIKAIINENLQQDTKNYYQENVLPFIDVIDQPVNPFKEDN